MLILQPKNPCIDENSLTYHLQSNPKPMMVLFVAYACVAMDMHNSFHSHLFAPNKYDSFDEYYIDDNKYCSFYEYFVSTDRHNSFHLMLGILDSVTKGVQYILRIHL